MARKLVDGDHYTQVLQPDGKYKKMLYSAYLRNIQKYEPVTISFMLAQYAEKQRILNT